MKNCEFCDVGHDDSYGSGRFCSAKCARRFAQAHKVRGSKDVSEELKKYNCSLSELKIINNTHTCEICGTIFIKNIRNGRRIHCEKCKRTVDYRKHNPKSIKDLSKRTITKIIKRAFKSCVICGWAEASLDLHHIIHKKNNGTQEDSNLIMLCPNCHRIAHRTNKFSIDFLKSKSIAILFPNWMEFYLDYHHDKWTVKKTK